jgi:hypothetical protein
MCAKGSEKDATILAMSHSILPRKDRLDLGSMTSRRFVDGCLDSRKADSMTDILHSKVLVQHTKYGYPGWVADIGRYDGRLMG